MKKETKTTQLGQKMTIYEYEERYSSRTSAKQANLLTNLVISLVGIFIFVCLFFITKEVYELNEYAGYGMIAVSVLIFVFLFIIPVIKIKTMRRFDVDVTAYTAPKAKRHNDKVRQELADRIIDFYLSTEGSAGIYSSESIKPLIDARSKKDKKALISALDTIYSKDIKKSAQDIIKKCSVKSGAYSAVSQKDTTDALLVSVINVQMVKDIIYLYGFRPSDTRLLKIFSNILTNSLIAYGLGNLRIGNTVARSMGDVVKNIPILGSAISVIVDSSVQGLSNATLTAIIGHNTIKYLMTEYNLQNILNNIELTESDEEFIRTCEEVKKELIEEKKKKKESLDVSDKKLIGTQSA